MNILFASILTLAVGIQFSPAQTSPIVSIVPDPAAGFPARHGAEKMAAALKEKQVSVETVDSIDAAKGKFIILTGIPRSDRPAVGPLTTLFPQLPTNAEALAIRKVDYRGNQTWILAGSDDAGLMYAELDVADRISWSTNKESPLSHVRDVVEKPDANVRGVTLYTMNRAYWESRFYDEAYWQRYLDTLARDRFNNLTVVFGYEDGGFLAPCYPYFFDVPEFADVKMIGITQSQQQQNIEALNRLITMAHARGIKLTVGIWDHIYRGNVQNGGAPGGNASLSKPTPSLVWGMTAQNLIPYTQVALKTFLNKFPGIDGIQFRVHDESGLKVSEQEQFWKATFKTVMETTPKMPIDLRAKGLTATEIQSAANAGLNFRISTKYWMEQMGLPFHPMHVNPADQANRRHGYADLLVYPQTYNLHWQLWNGGTARIFVSGDPEYARRFVETTHLYNSDGFEIQEPLATKMEAQPHDQKPFELLKPSARYYDYEFERYWNLLQVFGRIGYNPRTPSEVWDREFEIHFGAAAAPHIEKALHQSTWILPRIIASSYPYSSFPMTLGWAEKQHLGDLPTFAKATLSDVQLFENFDEEAQRLIEGGETAKVRPQETAQWFSSTAAEILKEVALAQEATGLHATKEFESTVVDLKMLANLASYHSFRIGGAVDYRLYERSRDLSALIQAVRFEGFAGEAWRRMVRDAEGTYSEDLILGAKSRSLTGSWRTESVELENGLIALREQMIRSTSNLASTNGSRQAAPLFQEHEVLGEIPTITHESIRHAAIGKPLTIHAQVKSGAGIKWVQVLFRPVNQTRNYETLDMKATDEQGNYQAVIPAEKIDPRYDFMYFLQVMDNKHHGVIYPDFNKQTPYFMVQLER